MLLGSAGMSVAALGYEGWQKFSDEFKNGYVTGFLAMATLARNLEPGGWVDMKYPEAARSKPLDWRKSIDKLYAQKENQGYTMASLLQLAAHDLVKQHGPGQTPGQRTLQRMQHQLDAVRRKAEAQKKLSPKEPKKAVQAPQDKVPPADKIKKGSAEPPKRKWCRCDGKDPKAERAKRRAAAAAAEAAKEGG
ncbi:MAG: hypothetical protein ABR587_04175, partial [Candidatus Binatia bacterium]